MKNYWKYNLFLLLLSIAVDYWIAKQLGSNNNEVWDIFLLILLIPLFFSVKSAVVKIFLWVLMARRDAEEKIFAELSSAGWPCPDEYDIENPEDYLTLVASGENNNIDIRLRASSVLGEVSAMYANQQVLTRLLWSSAFKKALKSYANLKEADINANR